MESQLVENFCPFPTFMSQMDRHFSRKVDEGTSNEIMLSN